MLMAHVDQDSKENYEQHTVEITKARVLASGKTASEHCNGDRNNKGSNKLE